MKNLLGQLLLELALPERPMSLQNFIPGGNIELLEMLSGMSPKEPQAAWIWGAAGLGKTHLLKASIQKLAKQNIPSVYYCCSDLRLNDCLFDAKPLAIALDDVTELAGDPVWEDRLLVLCSEALANQRFLFLGSRSSPMSANFKLVDLISRVQALIAYRILALNDSDLIQLMQQWVVQKGASMDRDLGQFLIRRCPRDIESLMQVIKCLDQTALVCKRRLTVSLAKQALEL